MNSKVYVVVVTFNPKRWLDKCLGSLRQSAIPVETIVVDNFSIDGSQEIVLSKYPEVELIQSHTNMGFGKANNLGIKKALEKGADYVFLLNQDAWINQDTIDKLVKLNEDEKGFGILSPIHLNGDGKLLDYQFNNYISDSDDEGRLLYSDLLLQRELKPIYAVDFVNAASWLLSKDVFNQVGYFDELFSHYGEDVNFSQRVKYNGCKIGVAPTCFIYHDREERRGKHTESFPVDYEYNNFLIEGLNPFNSQFSVRKSIYSDVKSFLKSVILLRMSRAGFYFRCYFKKRKVADIIERRANRYSSSWKS